MLPQHKVLFEPVSIGSVRLSNRLALAPTYVGAGDDRGRVTDQSLCYYYSRSAGGAGLVIVEASGVTGRYAFSENFGLSVASDRTIPGLRDLAKVIHWGGAKAIIQLTTGMGVQGLKGHERRPLVGPSDVPALLQKDGLPQVLKEIAGLKSEQPRPLAVEEIKYLTEATVRAAKRAKKAGFDGVEIHGAHGYILCQFTSPYYNRRTDDYGGSPEKRWRFSGEIIQGVKEALGQDFVVGYRFSAREWIPGGLELDESIRMAGAMEKAGADYLSVSHGCFGALTRIFPKEEGAITKDAAAVRQAVSIPVMCPNFQNPDLAAEAVANKSIDLAALSRPLLADPQWVQKVREGRPETIRPCARCHQCVRAINIDNLPVRCSVNPRLGFERFDPACLPRPA